MAVQLDAGLQIAVSDGLDPLQNQPHGTADVSETEGDGEKTEGDEQPAGDSQNETPGGTHDRRDVSGHVAGGQGNALVGGLHGGKELPLVVIGPVQARAQFIHGLQELSRRCPVGVHVAHQLKPESLDGWFGSRQGAQAQVKVVKKRQYLVAVFGLGGSGMPQAQPGMLDGDLQQGFPITGNDDAELLQDGCVPPLAGKGDQLLGEGSLQ